MKSRSLQLVGNRSHAITLPKEWILENRLKAQSPVFVEKTEKGDLLIHAKENKNQTRRELTVCIDDIENIEEFIVFCYIKNIDLLTLTSNEMDYSALRSVKSALDHLEGYDITNEDDKRIRIMFLFKDVTVTLQQILRRIIYILQTMLEALKKNDQIALEEMEQSVDRLYKLSKRIIFHCLRSKEARTLNAIKNEEDLFFIKDILKRLEGIGDHMVRLKGQKLTIDDFKKLEHLLNFPEKLMSKNAVLHELKKELSDMKFDTKQNEAQLRLGRIRDFCKDILESALDLEFNRKYFPQN